MADLVFRKIGSNINGGKSIWLRDTPASTLITNEFFEAPSGSSVFGYIKYWTGSAWVVKPVKYWTGSAWVQKPVKHWNGTAWTLTEYTP
jgi:hypothetical protein